MERLSRVERGEELLRKHGYKDIRLRLHGEIARIEIGPEEDVDLSALRTIVPEIKKLGFKYVTLDLEGFRSGSLND